MTNKIIKPTGYWSFICQPKKWEIDKFFKTNIIYDTYQIDDWQKEWFKEGQLGIIRVSQDKRTKQELEGRKKLESGVYAIVKVISEPKKRGDKKPTFWTNENYVDPNRYIVDIKYLKKLKDSPLLIKNIKSNSEIDDKYLINGWQGSSIPLTRNAFIEILGNIDETDDIFDIENDIQNVKSLNNLLNFGEYDYSTPDSMIEDLMNKDYQLRIEHQIEEVVLVDDKKIDKSNPIKLNGRSYYPRNTKTAKKVIINADYKCEYDCKHEYFRSKITKQNYVEAHHLIPMEFQDKFDYSLDVEANIISLCPCCHKLIHHGMHDEKIDIIKTLYHKRVERLKKCAIWTSEEELICCYK